MEMEELYANMADVISDGIRKSMYTGRVFCQEDLGPAPTTPDELKSALGYPKNKRWRACLTNLMGLCFNVRYMVAGQNGLSEFPLSSNTRGMIKRFGSQQMASKVMKKAEQVGLLKCTNGDYSYKYGKAKCYIWNRNVETLVLSLSKSLSITPPQLINNHNHNTSYSPSLYNGTTIWDGCTDREENAETLGNHSLSNPINNNSITSLSPSLYNGTTIWRGGSENEISLSSTFENAETLSQYHSQSPVNIPLNNSSIISSYSSSLYNGTTIWDSGISSSSSSTSIINGTTIWPVIGKQRLRASVEEVEPGLYERYPQLSYG